LSKRNTDKKWFDALVDRRLSASAETPVEQEARLVREALIQQRENFGNTTPSEAGFEKVLAEARQAGLFEEGRRTPILTRMLWLPAQISRCGYALLTHPAGVSMHAAATCVLVAVLVFSGSFLMDEPADLGPRFVALEEPATPTDPGDTAGLQEKPVKFEPLTRFAGAISAAKLSDWLRSENEVDPIVVTVDDPEAAASDWQRALSKADVTHAMSFEFPDQIRVFLPITRTSIELLRDRNIEVPAGEWCVLLIQAMRNNRP